MKKIEPAILKGTRDFLPPEMAKRNYVMARMRRIFERFGYAPIETPILTPAETILSKYGEEGDRLTYHFKDAGDRDIALPYDLTVPFARYVAANYGDLPMPFKRYQIQRVWRAEKPQKGRLREFYQCDIDVVGTKSLLVEAEMARIMQEVFLALGLKEFKIKFNSRKLMNEALESFGYEKDSVAIIRVIDKMDKIGEKGVITELKEIGVREAAKLVKYLSSSDAVEHGDLGDFVKHAKAMGVEEQYLQFDPTLARGLDYYTGIIFEVVSQDSELGTICAGGRYDNLTGMFEVNAPKSADPELSGMGVAFGFERIMLLLEEKGLLKNMRPAPEVLVTIFDETMVGDSLEIYKALAAAGVNTEIYFEPVKLDKQLKYADKKGIAYVVVCGPKERDNYELVLKDMQTGKQETLSLEDLVARLK